MAKPEYSGAWPRVRLRVLERDGYLCRIRGAKCTVTATQVDHIVPVSKGGAWWDEANLRASCAKCNLSRVDHATSERWRQGKTKITLVVGPPGSDKARYVESLRGTSDLVIDYDAISRALGIEGQENMHGVVATARNSVLRILRQGKVEAGKAWIISSNPDAESTFPFHDLKIVDPGFEEIANAPGVDPATITRARAWYAERSGQSQTETANPSRSW